jgi:dTDP-4-dehydrorhamnose 3,5-epimerase
MPFIDTDFPGLKIFEPKIYKDERGYFYESFNERTFKDAGINESFVQDNQSYSRIGTLRGLHYQLEPFAQSKLVRVIEGEVLDVVVDLRKDSPMFGKSYGIKLSGDNHLQLYIPRGFAHGYAVLSATALFFYKCDRLYNKESERGILYNDPDLNINWEIDIKTAVVSDKDKMNAPFRSAEMNFVIHG